TITTPNRAATSTGPSTYSMLPVPGIHTSLPLTGAGCRDFATSGIAACHVELRGGPFGGVSAPGSRPVRLRNDRADKWRTDMTGTVAVIGAGLMGSGIAQVAAVAGWDVVLRDITDDALRRGLEA